MLRVQQSRPKSGRLGIVVEPRRYVEQVQISDVGILTLGMLANVAQVIFRTLYSVIHDDYRNLHKRTERLRGFFEYESTIITATL